MTASGDKAHLWLAFPNRGPALGLDSPLLSRPEIERATAIRHPETREGFVAGRILARHALSTLAPVPPDVWEFEPTHHGRPEIAQPVSGHRLRFNLSHTAGLVACVVTESIDCGVDVESLDRRIDALRIARHSFTRDELSSLEGLGKEALARRFFALWTLKEAYLKARGSGIRLRLDAVEFVLGSGTLTARFSETPDAPSAHWQFSLFRPGRRHLVAVALAAESAAPMPIAVHELDLAAGISRAFVLSRIAHGSA